MSEAFDVRQVRRSFSRAAAGYTQVARLQQQVEAELLDCLDYRPAEAPPPDVVLDVGSGPGSAARAMQQRWPKAQVLAIDLSLPMLGQHARPGKWRRWTKRHPHALCADARALPLADGSVDVLFSNLCMQWVDDLPALLAEWRRVLRPGAMLLVSTFGTDTLHELRDAFAQADHAPHVSPFVDIAALGDALMAAGFRNPVLDRDLHPEHVPDLPALMRHLRALGATNAASARRASLTGKARFAAAAAAYEPLRQTQGLPVTWEVITALAWAPEPGMPRRDQDAEVASFPAEGIPIRRRM